MILYCAGGHAKVIMDILQANGVQVSLCFDDNPSKHELHGVKVSLPYETPEQLILCIGNNIIRKQLSEAHNFKYGTAIHPSAIISPSARIGEGTVIMPGVIIHADVVIGKHCIINTGSIIEHDCEVDDFTHVSPGATICGQVHLNEGVWIGAGATVINSLNIGAWSIVGAGATVIRDVLPNVVVAGCPAKFLRFVDNKTFLKAYLNLSHSIYEQIADKEK
jgi:sugar O-acyltransferase (sialic acid O-acetyltransferase NeuD family)